MNILVNSIFILLAALLIGLCFLYFMPIYAIGAFGIFSLAIISLRKPYLLFYVLFIWSLSVSMLTNLTFIGNLTFMNYVDEVLVLIMVVYAIFKMKRKTLPVGISRLVLLMLLFSIFSLISTLINKSSFFALFNYISTYLKIFVIFICAIILLDSKDMKKLILFMLFSVFVEAVIGSIQLFSYGRGNILVGPEITLWQDAASGSFGMYGAHIMSHYSMIFFMLSSCLLIFTLEKKWYIFAVVCLYALGISFAEQDYIFLAGFLSILSVLLFKRRTGLPIKLVIICSALLLASAVIFVNFKTGFNPAKRYIDYLKYPQRIKDMGKTQSLTMIKNLITQEPHAAILGFGPGSFSSGIAKKVGGEYFNKYIEFRVKGAESTLDYWWSNFSSLISETGLVGYVLYIMAFFTIFFHSWKAYSGISVNYFDKSMAFALCGIIIFLIYISFLSNALEWVAITFPPAIISAYVWKIGGHGLREIK